MRQSGLYALVVALAGVLMLLVWWWAPQGTSPRPLAPTPKGGDFTLESARGPVSLHDYRGKVVLVYFGYTFCPDICPTALSFTAQALSALDSGERAQVQLLFVSVDPGRDTPAHLEEYVRYFAPDFIGVTGDEAALEEIAARYGAAFRRENLEGSATGYLVDHTTSLYVVGRSGKLLGTISHGTPPQRMAEIIREALAAP